MAMGCLIKGTVTFFESVHIFSIHKSMSIDDEKYHLFKPNFEHLGPSLHPVGK